MISGSLTIQRKDRNMADTQIDVSRLFAKIGQQLVVIEMQAERIQQLEAEMKALKESGK